MKKIKLFVMRHGVAALREEWSQDEVLRPLTPEGIEKTHRAASGLRAAIDGEKIGLIASSPLLRAQQTAKIAREVLGVQTKIAIWPELEDAAFQPLLARLKVGDQSALIVGHEPGLSQWTSQLLCGSSHTLEVEWKKAAVCALDVEFSHEEAHATLLWFATPKQLRAIGGNSISRPS